MYYKFVKVMLLENKISRNYCCQFLLSFFYCLYIRHYKIKLNRYLIHQSEVKSSAFMVPSIICHLSACLTEM